MRSWVPFFLGALLYPLSPGAVVAADPPKVLLVTKSSGFEHSAIRRNGGEPSHVERVLTEVAAREGFELVATKDAGWIRAERLRDVDAVVFYTTGDLTQAGKNDGKLFAGDGEPPMAADGVAALAAWVEQGGAFLGFHSASDTFHDPTGEPSPYVRLLGGEFLTHGRQFEGTLHIVDSEHPTMASIPQGWTVLDEWYVFKNLAEDRLHVLALLETGPQREQQKTYDRPDYPVVWASSVGRGRVFYNAMGHREDVWDREIFQRAFVDALRWALGETELRAEPNYDQVVPVTEDASGRDGGQAP